MGGADAIRIVELFGESEGARLETLGAAERGGAAP
jgi:hypothetical protein